MGVAGGKEHRVLVVGAQGVGKTALLQRAAGGADAAGDQYVPTEHLNTVRHCVRDARRGVCASIEFLEVSGDCFASRELFTEARPRLRRHFATHAAAVVVVVDAMERDPGRIDLSRALMRELTSFDELADAVFLVAATKCDASPAAAAVPRRFLKFVPRRLRDPDAEAVELAALRLRDPQRKRVSTRKCRGSNHGGSDPDSAASALSRVEDAGGGCWRDFNKLPLVAEFAKPVCIGSYALTTTPGSPRYDPVRWVVEASEDGQDWLLISQQTTDYDTPVARGVSTGWHAVDGAMGYDEIYAAYDMDRTMGQRKWQLRTVSARTGDGVDDAMLWLATALVAGGGGTPARR